MTSTCKDAISKQRRNCSVVFKGVLGKKQFLEVMFKFNVALKNNRTVSKLPKHLNELVQAIELNDGKQTVVFLPYLLITYEVESKCTQPLKVLQKTYCVDGGIGYSKNVGRHVSPIWSQRVMTGPIPCDQLKAR